MQGYSAIVSISRMDTSGNGDLDAQEFVEGCMRLKGPARSIDVSLLMQENKRALGEVSHWRIGVTCRNHAEMKLQLVDHL